MLFKSKSPRKHRSLFRRLVRGFLVAGLAVMLLLSAIMLWFARGALYNRFVYFPKEVAAWEAIRNNRLEVTLDDGWGAYRGNCHSHSHVSHDSDVPFEEILAALKSADNDFIFMTDHVVDNIADYSIQWKGLYDGVLFVRGYEMGYGFLPWGLPDDTILKRDEEIEVLARQIRERGGILFFGHTEEERQWDLPELNGMEIYNLHTDTKDEDLWFLPDLLANILINNGKYPDQVIRLFFDPQTEILARWDELNKTRRITGIQGTDAHQNQGFRGVYTAENTFQIWDTSPEMLTEFNLNFLTRTLLRIFFGAFAPGDELFHFQLDPYERVVRYSSTHILANELTEAALCESLEKGRAYVAFDMIADARGFVYLAEDGGRQAVMGEYLPFSESVRLRAAAPNVGRIKVLRDGAVVHQVDGAALDWRPGAPGNYRVEVELYIVDRWVPWIYSNPITLTEGGAPT